MKLIRLILDQTNKNLCFTKTSSSSCRGVGAAKSTSPSWSSTCRNRQQDQPRLTCSAMIFLGIYDIYVKQNIGSNSMQILLVAECGAHSWRVSHQTKSLISEACNLHLGSFSSFALSSAKKFIFPATFRMTPKVSKI